MHQRNTQSSKLDGNWGCQESCGICFEYFSKHENTKNYDQKTKTFVNEHGEIIKAQNLQLIRVPTRILQDTEISVTKLVFDLRIKGCGK